MATTTPDDVATGERAAIDGFYQRFFADPLLRAFYGDSGFANLGYWEVDTPDAAAAGTRLVDEILALVPSPRGPVLDVACGEGGSTRRLSRYVAPAAITAVGISERQLAAARTRAPGCTFRQMDATDLQLADASFETVVCVEAAFHFRTRERFLREAWRVLAPGGYLAVSDLLMAWGTALVPLENHVSAPQGYRELLERCGFVDVVVVDATAATWRAFRRRFTDYLVETAPPARRADSLGYLLYVNMVCAWAIRGCLLAAGRKPGRDRTQA